MNKKELNEILKNDPYHVNRGKNSEADLRLYLREVDYHCPMCGKELQSKKQKKSDQKLFQIAHIYPYSPTIEQYNVLHDLERLGSTCESFDNKIALCLECHSTQDFHTTADEYLALLNKKKKCLMQTELNESTFSLGLEDNIKVLIGKLVAITSDELAELNYDPVPLTNKFNKNEILLKNKIHGYVINYYTYIRESLKEIEGIDNFNFSILSNQVKNCFIKMNNISENKSLIFSEIVNWIMNKTQSDSLEACEAIVSFFIQNCEVFYEITK